MNSAAAPLRMIIIFLAIIVVAFFLTSKDNKHKNFSTPVTGNVPSSTNNTSLKKFHIGDKQAQNSHYSRTNEKLRKTVHTRFGPRLSLAKGKGDLFYSTETGLKVALKMSRLLEELSIISPDQGGSCRFGRQKDGFYLTMYLTQKDVTRQETASYYKIMGMLLSAFALEGGKLEINLATTPFIPVKTISIPQTVHLNTGDNTVFFNKELPHEKKAIILKLLEEVNFFGENSSFMAFVEADNNLLSIKICLKDKEWSSENTIRSFTAATCRAIDNRTVNKDGLFKKVSAILCNNLLEPQITVTSP